MSTIVIPARRPASAAPARASNEQTTGRAVTFGAASSSAAAAAAASASQAALPARPGSAAVARSAPSAAAASAASAPLHPPPRTERPPFRPSSAHPRDAAFYSSSYLTSATAGVTTRERERSPVRAASASAAAHSVAAAAQPAEAAAADHSSSSSSGGGGGTGGAGGTSSGPSIPVRHTHRSSPSIRLTREAAESFAKEAAKTTAPMSTEALKAHYAPLLSSRHARLDDLKLRLRKQEARYQTMQAWKLKALDKAASEPNALDFVLTPTGVAQSLTVRSKRIILQRTIIRQFLRTFRLLRSLKIVHRHLRTMIPLLLDSPNSSVDSSTRSELAEVLQSWSREPVPLGPRASARPGGGKLGVAIPTDPLSPGSVPFSPQRGASVGWSPAPASVTSPLAVNARKATERYYLSRHPHSYTQTLLDNLFAAVPLLEAAITQNLQARQEIDQQNYTQMLRNTQLVSRADNNAAQIASKQAALNQLKADVECIESELSSARAAYVSCVDRLQNLVHRESLHQRRLNRIYYQEVSEKLGESYAVQLAIVQQGSQHPPPWQQAVQQQAPPIPPQIAAGAAAANSNPPAAASTRNKKLFLPTTLLGNTIPIAPDVIPRFDDSAVDSADSTSLSHATTAADDSAVKIRQIDRAALLHRIDSLLARNPSRSPAAFADCDSEAAREMRAAHQRFLDRQKLEAECARDEAHEHAAGALERDGLQPFFVLAGNPPPHAASGRSSKASSRRASRRRSTNPRSMLPSDSLGELSPDDGGDDGDQLDADADAGEDPEADRMFTLQRDHFALDYATASGAADDEESKQQEEWYTSRPNHHREDSAPPLPPSLLNPPAKPLAPLHARTLSEVDWHATGPTMPMAHRRRQLNTEERLAAERAKGKRNPHEYFPLTRERVASMIEENSAEEEKGGSSNSSRRQTRGGMFNLEDAAASLRSSGSAGQRENEDELSPSNLSQSGPAADAVDASSSPESQAWWDSQPASSASMAAPAATPPRHRSSAAHAAAAAAGASSSPVVGLSASVYSASLEVAMRHLLSLGYSEAQAREFAPHVVEVGAIRLPSSSASREPSTPAGSAQDRSSSHDRRPSSAASGYTHSDAGSRPSSMTQSQGAVYASALMKRPGGGGSRVPVHTMHAYQQPSASSPQSQSRGVMSARPSSAHHTQQRVAAPSPPQQPRSIASSSARPGSAAPARPSRPNSAALEARNIALMSGMPVSCLVPKPPSRPRPATAGASR